MRQKTQLCLLRFTALASDMFAFRSALFPLPLGASGAFRLVYGLDRPQLDNE